MNIEVLFAMFADDSRNAPRARATAYLAVVKEVAADGQLQLWECLRDDRKVQPLDDEPPFVRQFRMTR